jgi:tetratricopeptide (TPR) repeat protein
VADEQTVDHEYDSAYRGRVQNRKVNPEFLPMYQLAYVQYNNGVKSYQAYSAEVEHFNAMASPSQQLFVSCNLPTLTADQSTAYFKLIETLSAQIQDSKTTASALPLLMQRAVAYASLQNFDDAIRDLDTYLQIDSTALLAMWQRGVCQSMKNEVDASLGIEAQLKSARVLDDFNRAAKLSPNNPYIYYDRANHFAHRREYAKAIDDYGKALAIDGNLAEAYFNRGLARILSNHKAEGIKDLSKAGELGLYDAYSVIKKYK